MAHPLNISDRGKSFLAEGIDLFERENRIRHLATTPYHPQTNGMVERMHAMLGHGLTTLVHGKRDRWDEYLPQVLLALRTRTHAVTKFSPFFLLFGIHPRLPTDETPPQNTLAPLDDIEQMEENSEFMPGTWRKLDRRDPQPMPLSRCRCWTSRNLLDNDTQGLRLPNAVNQNDLAPWLAPVVDNIDFFYDGTNRNTALTGDETSTSH
ncbi:hypothetical protein BASA83_011005 [Batrachochytrium salamandrivorans]|nr:hypothetical protein BASA83_011005 [Batrachochytrium salamandrivorans]